MSQFGDVVKALRLADHLTLEQLARKVGSHKGYCSGWENDKVSPPSSKIIRKLGKVFAHRGISVDDLLELAWAEKAPHAIRARVLVLIRENPLFRIHLDPVVTPSPTVPESTREAAEAV